MAKVIVPKDVRAMNLPGRRAYEVVGAPAGAVSSTVRLVEIEPARAGEARRGPHVHHGFEECIHVLAGQGVTRTDEGEHAVAAGDTVLVPAEQRHATYNTGSSVLRLLCFFPVNDIRPGTVEFLSWDTAETAR
jgi:quercetin dioxygenase-like cupin family protein